jgi:hypothetical protein
MVQPPQITKHTRFIEEKIVQLYIEILVKPLVMFNKSQLNSSSIITSVSFDQRANVVHSYRILCIITVRHAYVPCTYITPMFADWTCQWEKDKDEYAFEVTVDWNRWSEGIMSCEEERSKLVIVKT